jgi:hypothetical protein
MFSSFGPANMALQLIGLVSCLNCKAVFWSTFSKSRVQSLFISIWRWRLLSNFLALLKLRWSWSWCVPATTVVCWFFHSWFFLGKGLAVLICKQTLIVSAECSRDIYYILFETGSNPIYFPCHIIFVDFTSFGSVCSRRLCTFFMYYMGGKLITVCFWASHFFLTAKKEKGSQ